MKLFTVAYNDTKLLFHFLQHYINGGATKFYIAAGANFADEVFQFCARYPITLVRGLDVADSNRSGNAAVTEMRQRYQRDDEWAIIVDLDEFIDFTEPVDAILATAEREGANVVRALMYDRFSADGQLRDVGPDDHLPSIFPIKARFFHHVMGSGDHKGVFVRGLINPVRGVGHHLFEDERLCSKQLGISHYKWTAGAIDRLRETHRQFVEARMPGEEQYRRALDHYDRHGGFAWQAFGGRRAEDFVPHVPDRCSECPAPLSEAEYRFSVSRFGQPLCRIDQKKHRAGG